MVAIKSFALILLLAIGLRFTGLTCDSLWLDESYQTVVESYGNELPDLMNYAARPFLFRPGQPASMKSVLSRFRKVDPLCPPLFALLMNRWLTVFGGSDLALRSLAASFSIISIAIGFWFGSALFDRRTALLISAIQALSPFDIAYAQEARMYSLMILCAYLSGGTYILLSTRAQQGKRALLTLVYVLSTWALINTHYTGLFIWACQILAAPVLAFWRKDWLLLAWVALANLLIAALSWPWFALFCQAAAVRGASFYVLRESTWWWPCLGLFVKVPLNWIYFLVGKRVMVFAAPLYGLASIILFIGFRAILKMIGKNLATLGWCSNQAVRTENPPDHLKENNQSQVAFLLLSWCLLPALLIWAADVIEAHRLIEIPRYVIGTAPAIYFIAAIGATAALRKSVAGYILIVCYAAFALANNVYAHVVPQREPWRQAAALVDQYCQTNEVILVSQYYDIVCLDRYLDHPLRQVGVSPAMGREKLVQILNNRDLVSQTFWLLAAQEGDHIFSMVPENFQVIASFDLKHAIHLRHYQRKTRQSIN